MTVTGRLGLLLLIVCLVFIACKPGPVVKQYGDDLVDAIGALTRRSADDTKRFLDDASRAQPIANQAEVAAWSKRIGRMANALPADWFQEPDDLARARSFVIGTACDAFEQLSDRLTVTEADVRTIVEWNWRTSGLPAILGYTFFIDELTRELQAALADGDLTAAYPEVARLALCQAAAG